MKINIYCAYYRNTIKKIKPKIKYNICFEIPCLECGGTGLWNFYPDEENIHNHKCTSCKGTGKDYIGL